MTKFFLLCVFLVLKRWEDMQISCGVFWSCSHTENWVLIKTVSFHFQSIKWALTLQYNNAKLWLGRSLTPAVSAQSFKISCSSGNGFWLVYKDLSIDFGRTNFLQNRDMACKLGCGLFLSLQLRSRNIGRQISHVYIMITQDNTLLDFSHLHKYSHFSLCAIITNDPAEKPFI